MQMADFSNKTNISSPICSLIGQYDQIYIEFIAKMFTHIKKHYNY